MPQPGSDTGHAVQMGNWKQWNPRQAVGFSCTQSNNGNFLWLCLQVLLSTKLLQLRFQGRRGLPQEGRPLLSYYLMSQAGGNLHMVGFLPWAFSWGSWGGG